MKATQTASSTLTAAAVLLFASSALLTGCQVDVAGQMLPSANFLQDDIDYHPKGSEMKVEREAAALKAYNEQRANR